MRALLLNASYEPLGVISWRRAVCLVLCEKAEIVAGSDEIVSSPSFSMEMPTVVRLTTYVKGRRTPRATPTLSNVLRRYSYSCAYCKGEADTRDHVHPRSRGGEHSWANVVAACRRCNTKKGSKTLEELGWNLSLVPKVPNSVEALVLGLKTVHPEWEAYLPDTHRRREVVAR